MERALKHLNNQVFNTCDFERLFSLAAPEYWMLVCDKSFGLLPENVQNLYNKHKENCIKFDGFESNPKYTSVVEGLRLFSEYDCRLIVAIGGGSTIDVAKCIKLFYGLKTDREFFIQNPKYDLISRINFIALPTTAGTGSESTRHAVIYYNGVKKSICDTEIIPDAVILEPAVLKDLPEIHKKGAMLDALCQACESWWSKGANDESALYSENAIKGMVCNWESYINGDFNAAFNIMKAANYSGRAINITKTTAAHAMSYKLSSLYNIPHGIAVALCFPLVWRRMISKADKKLLNTMEKIANCFGVADSYKAIEYFEKMLSALQIDSPHSDNREYEIDLLVESVNPERLSNNPVMFDKTELKEMYEEIVK